MAQIDLSCVDVPLNTKQTKLLSLDQVNEVCSERSIFLFTRYSIIDRLIYACVVSFYSLTILWLIELIYACIVAFYSLATLWLIGLIYACVVPIYLLAILWLIDLCIYVRKQCYILFYWSLWESWYCVILEIWYFDLIWSKTADLRGIDLRFCLGLWLLNLHFKNFGILRNGLVKCQSQD